MSNIKKSDFDKLRETYSVSATELREFNNSLPVLTTGLFKLDMAFGCKPDPELGNGGIRARDYVEVCGTNGSGKTALSYAMMRETIKRYGPHSVLAVLSEPGDLDRMEKEGVNPDDLIIMGQYHDKINKDHLMAGPLLDGVLEMVQHPHIALTVIDSFAALGVEKNEDKGTGDAQAVAGLAHVINSFTTRWPKKTNRSVGLFLNHYKVPIDTGGRNKMGAFVQPTDLDFNTIGGKTKDFLGKARVLMTATPKFTKDMKPHSIEGKREPHELTIKIKVGRNKYGPPLRSIDVIYNTEKLKFNNEEATLEYAKHFAEKDEKTGEWKTILNPPLYQIGSWYYIDGEKYQGIGSALKVLEEDPDLMRRIQNQMIPHHLKFFLDRKDYSVEDQLG